MEILSHLTLHGSWNWEPKNIVAMCKTNGGRNHILYLHSSIRHCKGLHKGGCLQPLYIQGKTCVLNLKINYTIKINETHDLNKPVAHCSTMSNHNCLKWWVFIGFCYCCWFFYMYTRNTPNPSDIHAAQHAMLLWKISWLKEGNLISIH